MRLARFLALAFAVPVAVVACTDDGDPPPAPPTTVGSTTPASDPRSSDARLTIGLLLPQGANTIGDPMIAAARRAREDISAYGDLTPERDVNIRFVEAPEGTRPAETEAGIQSLLAPRERVDAIVGPSSSTTTLSTLDQIVDAGVLSCSPTASSLLLDDYPDDNLFFRSIPSDSLQALAIARLTDLTGGREVSIAYLDDLYGRGLLDAVRSALGNLFIDPLPPVAISAEDESLDDQAEATLAEDPDVVIVLADNVEGPRMLAALSEASARRDPDAAVPEVIVNDAIRRPESPEVIRDLRAELRDQIQGVSPDAAPPEPASPEAVELNGNFSVNAYNCVTAIALAALAAESDAPTAIAAQMMSVTTLGQECVDFASCATLLANDENIDYQGPVGSGPFDLDSQGNVSEARFDEFEFNDEGVDTSTGFLLIP